MENNISDKIDQYLDGKMSIEEKTSFEKEISSNETLRQQIETQRNLRQGIERLNMKSAISSQFKKMSLKSKLYKWGIATVTIAVIASASYFGYNSLNGTNTADNYTLPTLNEEGKPEWSSADKNLPTQIFSIDPNKDTVLETEGGIVFAVPAGAFLNAKEPLTLEVREALTPMDIMKAGLSTMSDGKLLETGGMFYLNARNGEQSLKINPEKPVYANVPTNEIKPDMMLFSAERKADGSINWKNPKQLEKQLIPVDIHKLDFYPKGFREKCAELGFDANNKRVTDSIYYSYAGRRTIPTLHFEGGYQNWITSIRKGGFENYSDAELLKMFIATPGVKLSDTITQKFQINPASISAIWNDKYQNTIIATKEFEERLQYIFNIYCTDFREPVLNLYLQNLDKPIYQIDSMADSHLHFAECRENPNVNWHDSNTEFHDFYLRHDGGIAVSENHMKKLQDYFAKKKEAVQMAAEKTFATRKDKEQKEDKTYSDAKTKQSSEDAIRNSDNFNKEFDINLTEAYRQLGIERVKNPPVNKGVYYGFAITNVGWCNVDRYVYESTVNRTTLDYTDPNSGKKAVIKYEALTISINEENQFEQVQVYLVPDSLNSFMKVDKKGSAFEEKLNELFKYSLVVVGQKGKKWYWSQQTNVKPGNPSVQLNEIAESQLRTNLNTSFTKKTGADFRTELDMMIEQHSYNIQLKKRQKQEEIDAAIMPVIFPFYFQQTVSPFGAPQTTPARP